MCFWLYREDCSRQWKEEFKEARYLFLITFSVLGDRIWSMIDLLIYKCVFGNWSNYIMFNLSEYDNICQYQELVLEFLKWINSVFALFYDQGSILSLCLFLNVLLQPQRFLASQGVLVRKIQNHTHRHLLTQGPIRTVPPIRQEFINQNLHQ